MMNGTERFSAHGEELDMAISDFWSWAYSDLLNNTLRGVMAEFLVYSSFRSADFPTQMHTDWLPFDVTSPSGRRIEVKSAAYLQSCTTDFPAQIQYDIAPRLAWDGKSYATAAKRNCDIFVFCLYTALTRDKSILNLDYWEFYVLPTSVLNDRIPNQKTISLSSLLKIGPIKTDYAGLGTIIESIKL